MLEEQEAVRGRLFTIQDVMQSTVRAWLQARINIPNFGTVYVCLSTSSLKPCVLAGLNSLTVVFFFFIFLLYFLFSTWSLFLNYGRMRKGSFKTSLFALVGK